MRSVLPILAALIISGGLMTVDSGTPEGPSPVEANHPETVYPRVWRNWRSQFSQREIRWQRCNISDFEWETAGLAFNNWKSNFGHSTYHTYVGFNCTQANDENLRVWGRTTSAMLDGFYCPAGAKACFHAKTCYKAAYPYTNGCYFSELMNVIQGYIVYDYQWLRTSALMNPDGLPSPLAYAHLFGHEFGHAMALGHHSGCSPQINPSIMNGEGCTDMVDSGPPPNDVCVPDQNMGYGTSRC
jgi:hypothetical protein